MNVTREVITLPGTRSRPFSSAVRAGDLIFTSGHAGMRDSEGKALKTIEEQTKQTLESLKATLEASGATLDDVVKVTCFLGAQEHFRKMNEVYLSYFTGELPARSTCITGLAVPGMLLEMECVAYRPKGE